MKVLTGMFPMTVNQGGMEAGGYALAAQGAVPQVPAV